MHFCFDILWQEGLVTRIVGFFLLLLIYKFVKNPKNDRTPENFTQSSYDVCKNENCVRCNSVVLENKLVLAKQLYEDDPDNMQRVNKWLNCANVHLPKHKQRPTVLYFPDLSTFPIIDRNFHICDVKLLEANYDVIMQDYINAGEVLNDDDSWTRNDTPEGSWSVFYLINQGAKVEKNANKCPATMQILDELHNLLQNCAFGNACFSVVHPNTNITEHYGSCNVRTRCHLGLRIPLNCAIRIDDQCVSWEEGKCLLFDDSFLHSVTYSSLASGEALPQRCRVIFMVDLWHYDVTKSEQSAITKIFPSVLS